MAQTASSKGNHLFDFKLSLEISLIQCEIPPEELSRSKVLDQVPDTQLKDKDPLSARIVFDDVRLDGMNHYSTCVAKIAKRCKQNCGSKTKYYCIKIVK